MSIFNTIDYKAYVLSVIQAMPKSGHGQLRRIAEKLRVSPVVISQVFRGQRHLTLEQAFDLASFLGLSTLERDYLLLLVQYERAGSESLKNVFRQQIESCRQKSKELKYRLPSDKTLSESAKAIFYSSWLYSATRLLASIDGYQNPDSIAKHLGLPVGHVKKILGFLLREGLCEEKKGRIVLGPQRTHLGADSPFINRHRTNWRLKALERLEKADPRTDLLYSGPMVLSEEAATSVKEQLIQLIESASSAAVGSESEVLACLNIDWFRL